MRNVTITVDEEVWRWARVWAAKHDTSVSRMLGEMLRDRMEHEDAYWRAYQEWKKLSHLCWPISQGRPLPKREEIYASRRVRR